VAVIPAADRTDKPVTASRQGLDPTLAAGLLAKHSAQGRDLDREVAVLDGKAGPGGVDQRLLGHQDPRPLHQRGQPGDGTLAQGDGLGAAKQHLRLTIETKRTEDMGCNHHRIYRRFGRIWEIIHGNFTTPAGRSGRSWAQVKGPSAVTARSLNLRDQG